MRASVILNAAAGSLADCGSAALAVERVRAAFLQAGLEADIVAPDREAFPAALAAARASDADVVGVGGGDGTLSLGASLLMGGPKPLGILPVGTLNHFAKDLGIPLELSEAVAVMARGRVMEVDVGEVNGQIFLNNSSIGLYPIALDEREELRHGGGGKWPAMFNASLAVLRRFPLLHVALQVGGRAIALTTPFVFIGNNRYEMNLYAVGMRASLQGGELSLYSPRDGGRMGLLKLAVRALLGRLNQARDFHSTTLPAVEIRTRRSSVRVSLDGEMARMESPLRYVSRPRALRVMAPAA